MSQLNLLFMNPVSYGGHVTYTVHLMRGLRALGVDVKLFKVRERSEEFTRSFGYDEEYRNISIVDAMKLDGPLLITAPSKPKAEDIDSMLLAGARIVIHDPAEFKHGWDVALAERNVPIVIRKTMVSQVKNSVFIKHPYDKVGAAPLTARKQAGISISRIDFDKHTEIILDANRLLPKNKQISIRGFENRIYTRFNIIPKYPEWVQSLAAYPKELRTAHDLCKEHNYMVDMSVIKKDGGGTQYTFLEAIDAGAVCILNREWILKGHVMIHGDNCLAVSNGKELKDLVRQPYNEEIARSARKLLRAHDAKQIAKQYVSELLR